MVPKAPFLLGGGISNLVETVQECQKLCAAHAKCNYGTYISSGECWLSANRHSVLSEPCPDKCDSFKEDQAFVL